MPNLDLQGRVILVTGATGGIGLSLCQQLAAAGAELILLDQHKRKLERLYDAIVDAGHTRPALYPMNLEGAVADDYQTLATQIESEFGRLDGLFHLAALWGRHTPLATTDLAMLVRVMHVNVTVALAITQNCLPLLSKAERADILFMLDPPATMGAAYWGSYGISKAALAELAKKLSAETDSQANLRVHAYDSAGMVNTPSRLEVFPASDQAGWREPSEVASELAGLLSR